MTNELGHQLPGRTVPGRSARHWWRWILAVALALIIIVVAGVGAFIKLQPTAAPFTLSKEAAAAPAGPLNGTWVQAPGTTAGFRVQESALGFSNAVVGRTTAVTSTIVVSGDQVTSAVIHISLAAIKIGGKTQPQFARSLDTQADPIATFTLVRPVSLGQAFLSGATITVTATGRLAMHETSRLVTVTLTGRRDGSALQAVGSVPVSFSGWNIAGPAGLGFLGSLASHGIAEFLLILHHSADTSQGG